MCNICARAAAVALFILCFDISLKLILVQALSGRLFLHLHNIKHSKAATCALSVQMTSIVGKGVHIRSIVWYGVARSLCNAASAWRVFGNAIRTKSKCVGQSFEDYSQLKLDGEGLIQGRCSFLNSTRAVGISSSGSSSEKSISPGNASQIRCSSPRCSR